MNIRHCLLTFNDGTVVAFDGIVEEVFDKYLSCNSTLHGGLRYSWIMKSDGVTTEYKKYQNRYQVEIIEE